MKPHNKLAPGGMVEDLIVIKNGEHVTPTFSAVEMDGRLAKLRAHMAEARIEATLFTSYHNIIYFSEFLYCAFGRPYGLVVTEDSASLISANVDGGQPWRRTQGENLSYTDWHRDNCFLAVQKLIPDGSRVAIEFDHINLDSRAKVEASLPGSEFVDTARPAMSMRMFKSAEEIAVIKNGARIANIGGGACLEAIGEGVPEYEIALHSTRAMVREIAATYPHVELMNT